MRDLREDNYESNLMISGEDSDETKYVDMQEEDELYTGLDKVVGGSASGIFGSESESSSRGIVLSVKYVSHDRYFIPSHYNHYEFNINIIPMIVLIMRWC